MRAVQRGGALPKEHDGDTKPSSLERRCETAASSSMSRTRKLNRHGCDSGLRTSDGELKGGSSCTQDHMLPAERIEKNMLDIGQSRNTKPLTTGRCCIDLLGRDAKRGTRRLGEPDRIGLRRREPRVSESSTSPTPPRGAREREDALKKHPS